MMGKKMLVVCGAGISTAVIPDFRSKGTGLYDKVRGQINDPDNKLFTLQTIKEKFALFKEVINTFSGHLPQLPHKLLKHLEADILKIYTQNIDGLEEKAKINPDKLVYVHGSLTLPWKWTNGIERPSITLMGEEPDYSENNLADDCKEADFLLVMGTSLNINPFASSLSKYWPINKPGLILDYERNPNFQNFVLSHPMVQVIIGDLNEIEIKDRSFVFGGHTINQLD